MFHRRAPGRDPRTVAREIPGLLDSIFPRLRGSLAASLNRITYKDPDLREIPSSIIERCKMQHAMLFEIAMVHAELTISHMTDNSLEKCLPIAVERQRYHFDAEPAKEISEDDKIIIRWCSTNLIFMLQKLQHKYRHKTIEIRPKIPGMGWISSGSGDFSMGDTLIEVKNTERNFNSADFRQILIYFILKYAHSIENNEQKWTKCILINPRRNIILEIDFDYLSSIASETLGRLDIYQAIRILADSIDELRQ